MPRADPESGPESGPVSGPVSRLRITGATLIPVADEGPAVITDGWLQTGPDGRIEGLGSGTPPLHLAPADEVIDGTGLIVAPGFISSHSHLFTSGSRGLGSSSTLYGWCDAMYGSTREATPDEIYWCVAHGALDYIDAGVTTAFDFADPLLRCEPMIEGRRSEVGALRPIEYALRQIDAKADAGIRFLHAVQLDEAVGTDDEIEERFAVTAAHARSGDLGELATNLGPALMGAVQWSRRPDAAELETEFMRRFGLINQAHFLETREAVEHQRERFGWYDRAGTLGPDLIFGHFVQTTPGIIARAAETGCAMSWQPAANGRLASGIADIPAIMSSGMRIGLGLDDQACSDLADPWGNMRLGTFMVRANTGDPAAVTPAAALRMQTLGAAEALGIGADVGSLEPGKWADLVVADPRRPDVGPLWDPVASYVFSISPRNLRRVVIGGRTVSTDGGSTHPAAAEIRARLHETMAAIAARPGY